MRYNGSLMNLMEVELSKKLNCPSLMEDEMSHIGTPQREIIVEPIVEPVPQKVPDFVPEWKEFEIPVELPVEP
jgi:hypothetical protein